MISIGHLFLLAIPVACISWTITHEEVFRELHEYFVKKSTKGTSWFSKKFFYMLTCEYCLSHYVTILLLIMTKTPIVFSDWRGYVIAGFSLVWIANVYMSLFALLRIDMKKVRKEIENME